MPTLKKIARRVSLLLLCSLVLANLTAQPSIDREYQLKAVFLFNFTQFIEWPTNSYPSPETPLVIGILGENPFGNFLQETVSGEKANGHPISIRQFENADDVKNCHIVFINISDTKRLSEAISSLKGRNILTVGDASDFSKLGGIIRFYTNDNKIKLQINLEASKAANLVISSKLLRLSDVVSN